MTENKDVFEEANQSVIEAVDAFEDEENVFEKPMFQDEEADDFVRAILQNEEFNSENQQDKPLNVQIDGQSDEAINATEEAQEEVQDSGKDEAKQKPEERKYGKFKTPEELLHAYGELEKEFTRRSQKLKELESAREEPFKSDEDWKQAVDKFFTETPSAKAFAKDIANEILSHPELKKDKNCLSVALTRTLVSKFRTPEQLMSDGQFLKDYVLCSQEVKDAVISEYLRGIKAGEPPFILADGGMQCVSAPKMPRTIEEAGFMFLKDNK